MKRPIDALNINLRDFDSADEKTKQLAAFCNELLSVLKCTLS
jgi:hypothetical protein